MKSVGLAVKSIGIGVGVSSVLAGGLIAGVEACERGYLECEMPEPLETGYTPEQERDMQGTESSTLPTVHATDDALEPVLQPYMRQLNREEDEVTISVDTKDLPDLEPEVRARILSATVIIETPKGNASGVVLETDDDEYTVQIGTVGHVVASMEGEDLDEIKVTSSNGTEIEIESYARDWRTPERELHIEDINTPVSKDAVEDIGLLNPVDMHDESAWENAGIFPLSISNTDEETISPGETLWNPSFKRGYRPPITNMHRVLAGQMEEKFLAPKNNNTIELFTDLDPDTDDDMAAAGASGSAFLNQEGEAVALLQSSSGHPTEILEASPCVREETVFDNGYDGLEYNLQISSDGEPCDEDRRYGLAISVARLLDDSALEFFKENR